MKAKRSYGAIAVKNDDGKTSVVEVRQRRIAQALEMYQRECRRLGEELRDTAASLSAERAAHAKLRAHWWMRFGMGLGFVR